MKPKLPGVQYFGALCTITTSLLGFAYARSQQPSTGDPSKQQRPRRVEEAGQAEESGDVLRIDTDLVPVDVSVTDKLGRPVRTLRLEDFKLFEDGVERPIAFFNKEKRGGDNRPIA